MLGRLPSMLINAFAYESFTPAWWREEGAADKM